MLETPSEWFGVYSGRLLSPLKGFLKAVRRPFEGLERHFKRLSKVPLKAFQRSLGSLQRVLNEMLKVIKVLTWLIH